MGIKVRVARAGFLHCATSGNAAVVIPARVLCCGKAGRFLFSSLEARKGFSRPSPTPGLRPAAPSKDQTRPLFPHSRLFGALLSLGGTPPLASRDPFLSGDQEFILDFLCCSTSVWQGALLNAVECHSILFFEGKCTLSFPFQYIQPFRLEKSKYATGTRLQIVCCGC